MKDLRIVKDGEEYVCVLFKDSKMIGAPFRADTVEKLQAWVMNMTLTDIPYTKIDNVYIQVPDNVINLDITKKIDIT